MSAQLLERRDTLAPAPAGATETGGPVVAAVDGTAPSRAAARAAARLARAVAAPLVLVYVRTGPPAWLGKPYFQKRLESELGDARTALADARAVAEDEGARAEVVVLEGGSPARRVVEFANDRGAQVVTVGARQRRLRRSFTRRLLRQAPMPVLTVRA
jgi:nucleotide-binding universal stress UspA family protein